MLIIVEESQSKYHSRLLKLLKLKGFLEEKDIIQFCLLDMKHCRQIINSLLSEGFI
jgi:ribosomal protein S8